MFIMVIAHPVADILSLPVTAQLLPVIITQVTVFDSEIFDILRHYGNFIAMYVSILQDHVWWAFFTSTARPVNSFGFVRSSLPCNTASLKSTVIKLPWITISGFENLYLAKYCKTLLKGYRCANDYAFLTGCYFGKKRHHLQIAVIANDMLHIPNVSIHFFELVTFKTARFVCTFIENYCMKKLPYFFFSACLLVFSANAQIPKKQKDLTKSIPSTFDVNGLTKSLMGELSPKLSLTDKQSPLVQNTISKFLGDKSKFFL